jgi:cytoskeletal protein CcmA (bactofilin family)
VSGTVDGALEATGDIEIAGAGKVSGTVTAYHRLVVGSEASLIGGDVRVARLTVEDGATFSGKVSMGKHVVEAATPPEPEPLPQPVEEVVAPVEPQLPKPLQQKGRRR